MRRFDESFDGALGVAVIDLKSGRTFALHGATVFPQASVIKIPILARIFQAARAGKFSLDDKVTEAVKDGLGLSARGLEILRCGRDEDGGHQAACTLHFGRLAQCGVA
ncbi:MAG: serine hydrolase [Bryobacteraceae bacterium]